MSRSNISFGISYHRKSKSKLKNANKEFNPNITYKAHLEVMKLEFETRWHSVGPSPLNDLDNYKTVCTLGKGSFGAVKLVIDKETNEHFAVKFMSKAHIVLNSSPNNVKNEKQIMLACKHPFIMPLLFSFKNNSTLYMGLPLMSGGVLWNYHRKVRKFDENLSRFYASQILLALEYLHYMNLIYRDLKPENIMINTNGYIKLTDFGYSKRIDLRTMSFCGTPEYLAPEMIQSRPYSRSIDIWAFGVIVFEFAFGKSPFSEFRDDQMMMYEKICKCSYELPKKFTNELKDLITNILQFEVSKRLGCSHEGINEIRNHPWFKSIVWFGILNQEITPNYIPIVHNIDDLRNFEKEIDEKPEDYVDHAIYEKEFKDF